MSGIYIGLGRIIGTKYKTAEELGTKGNLLELSVAVDTGERKKEGMQYAPSQIFVLSIWDKRADAVEAFATVGKHVFFKGQLTQPNLYLKEGEPQCQQKIVNVDELKIMTVTYGDSSGEASSEEATTATAKTSGTTKKTSSKKAKAADPEEDLADLDFS